MFISRFSPPQKKVFDLTKILVRNITDTILSRFLLRDRTPRVETRGVLFPVCPQSDRSFHIHLSKKAATLIQLQKRWDPIAPLIQFLCIKIIFHVLACVNVLVREHDLSPFVLNNDIGNRHMRWSRCICTLPCGSLTFRRGRHYDNKWVATDAN